MFTGLIQTVGRLTGAVARGGGRLLSVDLGGLARLPAVGASVALSGACQTVVAFAGGAAQFFAAPETLNRTTLGAKKIGDYLNLEPALRVGDPLDGHLVTGHIDAVATVLALRSVGESRVYEFSLPSALTALVAEKGSIAVDGISLTVSAVTAKSFSVSVIPHTLRQTTLAQLSVGDGVNIETDILARYVARRLSVATAPSGITDEFLLTAGF
ncbi:riboflavin synthase subunit alpha [Planctomycetales bacterium]|nr:riboflavin synthase subunit alpha [Planctomycetales bacterium]